MRTPGVKPIWPVPLPRCVEHDLALFLAGVTTRSEFHTQEPGVVTLCQLPPAAPRPALNKITRMTPIPVSAPTGRRWRADGVMGATGGPSSRRVAGGFLGRLHAAEQGDSCGGAATAPYLGERVGT